MAQAKQPLVDDELYVNEATLEALGNKIESEVKRSLQWTVMVPLLLAGVVLILFGVFWLIPQEVGTLVREDPIIDQRFRAATAEYLADPAGGGKVIREQIATVVRAEKEIKEIVEAAVGAEVSSLNLNELVQDQVNKLLERQPLATWVEDYLESEEGKAILTSAVTLYFDSDAGKNKLSVVAFAELASEDFRKILVEELDQALSH